MPFQPNNAPSPLTLAQLDLHLDHLAAHSPFSQLHPKPLDPPPQATTLAKLFKDSSLSPYPAGLLAQIILRDIRPYTDPLPSVAIRNPTSMLRKKSTGGPPQLDLLSTMTAWDPRMAELYMEGKGDIDWCADMAEAMQRWDGQSPMDVEARVAAGPVLGVNVQVCPPGSPVRVLTLCRSQSASKVALLKLHSMRSAEPSMALPPQQSGRKRNTMDTGTLTLSQVHQLTAGRMQIHLEIKVDDDVKITVFSKSKRNATLDRINTHSSARSFGSLARAEVL